MSTDMPDDQISDFDPYKEMDVESIFDDLREATEKPERNTSRLVAHVSPDDYEWLHANGWISAVRTIRTPAPIMGGWPYDIPEHLVNGLPIESQDYVDSGDLKVWEIDS